MECQFCTDFFLSLFSLNVFQLFSFAISVITARTKLLKTLIQKFFCITCKNFVSKIGESEYNNTEVGVKAIIVLVIFFTPKVTLFEFGL